MISAQNSRASSAAPHFSKPFLLSKKMIAGLYQGELKNILKQRNVRVEDFVFGHTQEGMKKIISHVASLGEGLVVGGEGLNEITMQGLSFAQAHLFKSWHTSIKGLERTGGCKLNDFLFGKLCRTFGYANLGGREKRPGR